MSATPTHRKPWMRYVTGDLIADGKLSIGDGYRAKNSELGSSGIPFARVGNIDGGFNFDDADRFPEEDLWKVGDKISQPGDVVFTSKGTVGRLALVRDTTPRFVYAPQICFWRTLDSALLDCRWLYYWMYGKEFGQQMSAVKGQTDMADYVSLGDQRRMEVRLPPIDEQHAIAGVLGALDDKIEQNQQTACALERLTRATFRAWFVDFEPVKAKAAGAGSFPSMPQHVFDSLPTRFVDSEIGPVPEGWEVKAINECIRLTMGQSPPSQFYNDRGEGLPFHQGVADYGFRFPNHRIYCTTEGRIAEPSDVLLSVRAPVGRINVADRQLVLGRGLAGLRHLSNRQSFLLQQIGHVFAEEDAVGDGTIYKAVTKRFLEQMPILSPSEQVQDAFENLIRPFDDFIAMCEAESRKLAETRDLLLPKLLAGDLRVNISHSETPT